MAIVGAIIFALLPIPLPATLPRRAVLRPSDGLCCVFIHLNVLLAVFNMIPVPPLDGGNVLIGLLPHSGARVVEQLRPYGFLILYGLMLTGALSTLLGRCAIFILRFLLGLS